MSSYSDYADAASRILEHKGEALGQAAANKGSLWGSTIANLGQVIPVQVQQVIKQRAEQKKTQQIQSIIQQNGGDLEKSIPLIMGIDATIGQHLAEQHAKVQQSVAEVQKIKRDADKAQLDFSDRLWSQVHDEDSYARAALVSHSLGEDVPPQFDPGWVQQKKQSLLSLKDQLEQAKPPEPFTLSPGQKRFDAAGKVIAEVEKPAAESGFTLAPGATRYDAQGNVIAASEKPAGSAPNVGSFEDFVIRKYGPNPTDAQILAARKAYGQADDRPRVSVSMSGMGGADRLTPEAIADTATRYRIFGQTAIPTRIEGPERVRIMNEAANQQRALGQSAAQAVQKQAAFKSDAAALTKMSTMKASAESFENKAINQAGLVSELSKKVGRSSYPIINSALLAGKQQIAGDTDTQLLFNALSTFTAEYAKIMEGSTGSVAAASDSARKSAAELIGRGLSNNTMQATLAQMQKEMRWTIQGYDATIEHITDRMGGQAAPKTDPLGIR